MMMGVSRGKHLLKNSGIYNFMDVPLVLLLIIPGFALYFSSIDYFRVGQIRIYRGSTILIGYRVSYIQLRLE